MDILVTGGAGFIGSHLVDRLVSDGHCVTVLDNLSTGKREQIDPRATLVEGDVSDAMLVQTLAAKSAVIFHLAAVASVEACTNDWLNAHKTNLTGSVTVFDAAARAGKIPVVYISSAAIYGDNPNLPLPETAQPHPLSAYGLDKLSAERYAAVAFSAHQVPTVGLRLFNVYGPRQDARSPYSGVISKFMAAALAETPLPLRGDGTQTRDFIYVADVVTLLLKAWAHAIRDTGASVFNGCTGKQTSIQELVAALASATQMPCTTTPAPSRTDDILHSCGDPAQARTKLGFVATTTLVDGLSQLAAATVA